MLIVKIELHSAITGEVSEIGRMKLSNDGTGTRSRGNYRGELQSGRCAAKLKPEGEVKDFARLSYSAWELVRLMLNDMHNKRKT